MEEANESGRKRRLCKRKNESRDRRKKGGGGGEEAREMGANRKLEGGMEIEMDGRIKKEWIRDWNL